MEFEIQPLDGQPILPKRPQPIFAHLNGRSVSFSLAPPRPSPKRKRAEPFRARALSRRGQTIS
jgi:hypothetical protein